MVSFEEVAVTFIFICLTYSFQDNGINAELGLAASEDAMLDGLVERAEKEIISGGNTGKNLIGHSGSFLSKLCRNFSLMQKVIAILFYTVVHSSLLSSMSWRFQY